MLSTAHAIFKSPQKTNTHMGGVACCRREVRGTGGGQAIFDISFVIHIT